MGELDARRDFETILDLGDGMRWVALDAEVQSNAAGRLSQTAVHHYHKADLREGNLSDQRRYYALTEASGDPLTMPVVLVADRRNGEEIPRRSLVAGYRNTDPYPEHGSRIAALSTIINVPLPPETCPYRRQPEPEEETVPFSP